MNWLDRMRDRCMVTEFKTPEFDPRLHDSHRGRVWRDDGSGWWRYVCQSCDYGAGSVDEYVQEVVWPWLMDLATEHARQHRTDVGRSA